MGTPARIIVVDDDESIVLTVKAILESEGYAVDISATGKEAIEKSEKTVYNVALIDIKLPDMEGIELLTRMKASVPRMRKIIVTGYPTIQNASDATNKNADAYLIKPVDVEKLLKLISEQLKQQKAERKESEQKITEFIEAKFKESGK